MKPRASPSLFPAVETAIRHLGLVLSLALATARAEPVLAEAGPAARVAFQQLLAAPWQTVFTEEGTGDWRDRWMLDGLKAEVRPHARGLYFQAGPIADDHASHAVLWTRPGFRGPLRVEFDYTRMDTVNRGVNILYLLASGTGEGPYAEDIATWTDRREIPYMATYFDHMHLLHISYAAYELDDPAAPDYVRARRYPRALTAGSFDRMQLAPDYADTGLFPPGQRVRVVVLKDDDWLFFSASSNGKEKLFAWSLDQIPALAAGRVGIRHMFQRAALYENFRISKLVPSSP